MVELRHRGAILFVSSRSPWPSILMTMPLSVPKRSWSCLVIQKTIGLLKGQLLAVVWLEPWMLYPAIVLSVASISFVDRREAPAVFVSRPA